MYKKYLFFFIIIPFMLFSCNTNKATRGQIVYFENPTNYRVDIYMGINPDVYDENTEPLVSLGAGETKKKILLPSSDTTMGDTFYVHYSVRIVNAEDSGVGQSLYAKAERRMHSFRILIKDNGPYKGTINEPDISSLKFRYGYIKVVNTSPYLINALNGYIFLEPLGKDDQNIKRNDFSFYRIKFSQFGDNKIHGLNFLIPNSGTTIKVPEFQLAEGKLYTFEYDGSNVTRTESLLSILGY